MLQGCRRNDAETRTLSGISVAGILAIFALVLASLVPAGAGAVDGSSISIVVWQCPPGTTPESVSLAVCDNASGGTTFTLSSETSPMSLTWTTGTIEGSGSGVEGIAAGTYTIAQEGVTGGAYHSWWRCGALGGGTPAVVAPYSEGQTLEITIADDTAYRCDWIVAPTGASPVAEASDGVGTVNVVAHLCPSTVSQSSSYDELVDACVMPPDGVGASFSAWDNPPTVSQGIGASFDHSGRAELTFDELPAGPIVVVATIPDGFGKPVVYCSDSGDVGTGEPKSYTERIQWVLLDDMPLTCHFFNFPA